MRKLDSEMLSNFSKVTSLGNDLKTELKSSLPDIQNT